MKHWIYASLTAIVIFILLFKFNPFKHKSVYSELDEMKHEHHVVMDSIDSTLHDVIYLYNNNKITKQQLINKLKLQVQIVDTQKTIVFDTIKLPYPINDTIKVPYPVKDIIKVLCYDTIWLYDTLTLISKPKLFGKYDTDTLK